MFTPEESRLLNRIQSDIEICHRPFRIIAEDTGFTEQHVIDMTTSLKERNIIRNISAIFNASALGYKTSLVAFKIKESRIDEAAAIINQHPGVSHNYLREHSYNIWFTLAVSGETTIETTAAALAQKCGAEDYLILKTEKLYKIGLSLDTSRGDEPAVNNSFTGSDMTGRRELSQNEKKIIVLLQKDLPVEERPFLKIADEFSGDITEDEIIQTGRSLKKEGFIRRYSAVLKHRRAGFTANAMTVWRATDEKIEKAADIFRKIPAVSHLYKRTVYPGKWEYPLFAMIHGRERNEVDELIKKMADESGIKDYMALYSTKEFKKKRVAYFSKEEL